jgi:hypothetical protein
MLRRTVGPVPCLVVASLVVALVSSGCGAAGEANPEKVGPRGVDELVIPTPSPDPDDFVRKVDNAWLPLVPGTVWTYDVAGSATQSVEVRVEQRRETVGGISCVVVHHTATDNEGGTVEGDRFYAQDRSGNVWLFGERPTVAGVDGSASWMAGVDGAQAGVAMLATPRLGDGYLHERAPAAAERSTVLALDEERTVPAGTFGGLLLTEDTSTGADGDELVVSRAYAEGIGLVEETTTVGGAERLVLASVTVP